MPDRYSTGRLQPSVKPCEPHLFWQLHLPVLTHRHSRDAPYLRRQSWVVAISCSGWLRWYWTLQILPSCNLAIGSPPFGGFAL